MDYIQAVCYICWVDGKLRWLSFGTVSLFCCVILSYALCKDVICHKVMYHAKNNTDLPNNYDRDIYAKNTF